MALAHIMYLYREEMICDLAQTYHIHDYRALPARYLATLVCGLGADSRVMKKMIKKAAPSVPVEVQLLAGIYDRLSILIWFQTKDGHAGRNRPEMITDKILCHEKQKKDKHKAFASGREFERARQRIINGGK
ncbi:MAG: hypothetical protein IJU01_00500 [Lachnospiraceae bacterium]|nr:hypothetical protein [Lachnospiraceae bacterium]